MNEYNKKYGRSISGKLMVMFHNLKDRNGRFVVKKREGFAPLEFTSAEYKNHMLENTDFLKIFNVWIKSGFEKCMTPTTDRIDNLKGYTLKNIQCLPLSENALKDTHYKFLMNPNREIRICQIVGCENTVKFYGRSKFGNHRQEFRRKVCHKHKGYTKLGLKLK